VISKVARFSARSSGLTPADLVQDWPADYWDRYQHPVLQAQLEKALKEPLQRILNWILGKSPELPGFILYGPPGFGKTATALSLGLFAARAGRIVRFTTAERLAAKRESTTYNAKEGQTYLSLMDEYLRPEILIIDDVITREYTGNVRALLLDLIRERKSLGRLSFLTTNIELGSYPDTEENKALNEAGRRGRDQFARALDGRMLSTYTGSAYNAREWGINGNAPQSLRGLA
jgi:DNA polymerase III delta prime subunit